jgi:hypothetical protein
VVNEIFDAGDAAHGVQTAAYNLPNDERVVTLKGSKRVMLKNVQEAKFHSTLEPIAKRVLSPAGQKDLSFDSFFTHILAHELSHGIGPHQITIRGRATSPRQELKELYSAIEEAKADVTGLFMLQHLYDRKLIPGGPDKERQLYTTFLASTFRTLRFGLNDAHGKGMAMQVNYLTDQGGFVAHPDGTFEVNFDKIRAAVRDLDHELLTLEATGDYAGAKKMLDEAGRDSSQYAEGARRSGKHPGGYQASVRDGKRSCAGALASAPRRRPPFRLDTCWRSRWATRSSSTISSRMRFSRRK